MNFEVILVLHLKRSVYDLLVIVFVCFAALGMFAIGLNGVFY